MTSFSFTANTFQDVVDELNKIMDYTSLIMRGKNKESMTDNEWLDYLNAEYRDVDVIGDSFKNLDYMNFHYDHDKTLYRAISKRVNNRYHVEGTIRRCFTVECKQCGHILYFDKYAHNENDIEDKDNYICEECGKNGNQ